MYETIAQLFESIKSISAKVNVKAFAPRSLTADSIYFTLLIKTESIAPNAAPAR